MKNIVLKCGLIAGVFLAIMVALIPITSKNGTVHSEVFGYSTMVLAFIMVFVGVRSYREKVGGGVVTFGRAFLVGLGIVLIAATMYVATWEVVYYKFMPDFGEKYAASMVQKMEKSGASPEKIAAEKLRMDKFWKMYQNPLVNIGFTYMEILPVGLIMSLIAAAILRRRQPAGMRPTPSTQTRQAAI